MITGRVAEWSIAPVLKTGDSQGSVSSNLTASARQPINKPLTGLFCFLHTIKHTKKIAHDFIFSVEACYGAEVRQVVFVAYWAAPALLATPGLCGHF